MAGCGCRANAADEFSMNVREIPSVAENTDDFQIIVYLAQGGGLRGVVQGVAEFDKKSIR